jgi:hypothetical protein
MPTYRSILKKSIVITLSHKRLLLLGLALAILGNGGEYDIFAHYAQNMTITSIDFSWFVNFFTTNLITIHLLSTIKNLALSHNPITNFSLIIALAGIVYFTVTAQGTIIASIYNAVRKKHKIAMKKNWSMAREKFWELLVANIFFKLGGILLAILISAPFFMILKSLALFNEEYRLFLVGLFIFTPIAIISSFLVKYTLIFIIAKDKSPWIGFVESVKLFKENWLITLENSFLLFSLNVVLGYTTLIMAFILSFPIASVVAITAYPNVLNQGDYATIIAWMSIILILIFGSMLAVFQYTTWTILFTKLLARRKFESKLERTAARIFKKI